MMEAEPPLNKPSQLQRWGLVVCLVVAIALRMAVIWLHADDLTIDRDAYLGIAHCVAEGKGYSDVDRLTPTAFRPPFYTLILAGLILVVPTSVAVAVINLVWGIVTVWAVWRAGQWLGLGRCSIVPALLVAIDPMLLQYSAQPMTEVTCAGLVALLTLWMVRRDRSAAAQQFAIGLVFGCLVLCRPTFWPLAALAIAGWTVGLCFSARPGTNQKNNPISALVPWRLMLGTIVVVAPWVIRNQLAMGSPVLMTTHGGYTLLLANNPVFYSEVVDHGWGASWSQESFDEWQRTLRIDLEKAVGANASEIDRDRWQSQQARQFIAANPGAFLRAIGYRIRSLWSTVPQGEAAATTSSKVVQLVGWYYTFVLGFFVVGMLVVAVSCRKAVNWQLWWPLFALVLTVQLVHLVYWTNARMRAPIVPVISLFAAAPIVRKSQNPPCALAASSAK